MDLKVAPHIDRTNLMIRFVPHCFDQRKFTELFERFGEIEKIKLVYKGGFSSYQRCNAGYGFVKFKREQDAEFAMQQVQGLRICNKILKVNYAHSKPGTTVRIRGFHLQWNEIQLMNFISKYGPLLDLRIIYNKSDPSDCTMNVHIPNHYCHKYPFESTGKAYVIFEHHMDALNAVKHLHGIRQPDCDDRLSLEILDKGSCHKRMMLKSYEQHHIGLHYYYTVKITNINIAQWSLDVMFYGFMQFGEVMQAFIIREMNGSYTGCVIMRNYMDAVNAALTLKLPSECNVRVYTTF